MTHITVELGRAGRYSIGSVPRHVFHSNDDYARGGHGHVCSFASAQVPGFVTLELSESTHQSSSPADPEVSGFFFGVQEEFAP